MNLFLVMYTVGTDVFGYATVGTDDTEVIKREADKLTKQYGKNNIGYITLKPLSIVDGYKVVLEKHDEEFPNVVFGRR